MQTETRVDVSHYTYRVAWSAEDGEFVATCLELPLAVVAGRFAGRCPTRPRGRSA